jgi:hypothetical protein
MAEVKTQKMLLQPDPDKIVDIPVGQLLLDSKNARLAWRVEGDSQEDLVRILWTEMAVDEVALSIAGNGFFRSEPLFVIIGNPEEEDPRKRKHIVVEGNRRLAAVLLLRNEELRRRIRATNLPDIDEARRAELDELPAIIYTDRESLWTTVGFRHINGIKPWDSFSKAQYVADVHETYDIPLDEIAERLGDRHDTVKRLYRGWKLLEQGESEGVFDREDTFRGSLHFSHLYTAADQRGFQNFLGIDSESSLRPNPVPETKIQELGELLVWLYGKRSERIEPIIRTQNPDLRILREVISKPESLSILRSTNSLQQAHAVAIGDKQRFRDALIRAKLELQNAKSTVTTGYDGKEELYDTIQDIVAYAESIRDEMQAKIERLVSRQTEQARR